MAGRITSPSTKTLIECSQRCRPDRIGRCRFAAKEPRRPLLNNTSREASAMPTNITKAQQSSKQPNGSGFHPLSSHPESGSILIGRHESLMFP
jgi:hypothetical protein